MKDELKNYRVTFSYPRPGIKKDSIRIDVAAASSGDAFKMAYNKCKRMLGEGPEYVFENAITEEVIKGPKNIGVVFSHSDEYLKKTWSNHMIIRAETEEDAVKYYNEHYKGKRFYQPWPTKIDENGPCVYGEVKDTYFASCLRYDANALEEREVPDDNAIINENPIPKEETGAYSLDPSTIDHSKKQAIKK